MVVITLVVLAATPQVYRSPVSEEVMIGKTIA